MNMHIKSDCQDEQLSASPEHDAAMMAMDMRRAAQVFLKLSEDASNRDALAPVLDDLNLVRVAIQLVTERIECREAA